MLYKILPSILSLFLLLSCATPAPTKLEKDAAMNAAQDCLYDNVDRLDDRVSDAETIAMGLIQVCWDKMEKVRELAVQGSGSIFRDSFNRSWRESLVRKVLPIVLKNRMKQ